ARILLAMSAHPVSPFESVYTSEKHLLMQDAYHQVIKEYARFCFVKADEFKLAADHIAVEFEFMSLLIERSLSKLEAGDKEGAQVLLEEQQRFLTTHLLNWVYRFCEDFANAARTDFYRGVAETTVACLDFDREYFGLVVC
ncbi:MAG: molecular chaperone TorD family protein, partial [Coriobacteriales bacterium]|nr:molecular chaperone TorD family protein [Coriobacteriales bacterium]